MYKNKWLVSGEAINDIDGARFYNFEDELSVAHLKGTNIYISDDYTCKEMNGVLKK